MNSILLLLISGLVSLHQYLPADSPKYNKQFTDIRDLRKEQIFPAAHHSCRYLYDVFTEAGVQQYLGGAADGVVGDLFAGILGSQQGVQSVLSMVDSPFVTQRLSGKKVNASDVKALLQKVCSEDFNPLSFLPYERDAVFEFIQNEIRVLDASDLDSLGQFNNFGVTQVYDRNDKLIGELESPLRQWTPYKEISPALPLSLIAIEDKGFLQHQGVEAKSVARIAGEATTSEDVTGGSTITMQLLKNIFFEKGYPSSYEELNSGSAKLLLRKVREWYWAKPFEHNFSRFDSDINGKERVLELYFNIVSYGRGIQGVHQASQIFFAKKPADLNIAEAAFLASLMKAPSRYSSPDNYAKQTQPRRDRVLSEVSGLCEGIAGRRTSATQEALFRMCRDPEGKAVYDQSEIKKWQEVDLPDWQPETRRDVPLALRTVLNYVQSWLPSFLRETGKQVKQVHIKTTVDSDLQKIVFNTVRHKLDIYDRGRQARSLIEPARDDRSRLARIRASDLGAFMTGRLARWTDLASTDTHIILPNVFLGKIFLGTANKNDSLTLQEGQILNALDRVEYPAANASTVTREILTKLRQQSSRLGEASFVSLSSGGYQIMTPTEFVDRLDYDEESLLKIREWLTRESLAKRLQKNSLTRLYRFRHRDYLIPALLLDNGRLIDKEGNDVRLFKTHRNLISWKFNRAGNFFWLRTDDPSVEKPIYSIDAPRLQAAAIVMDTETGEVLAHFSGYDPSLSTFDRSLFANRQLGSTVKPWVYYLALNRGFQPADALRNWSISLDMNKAIANPTGNEPENYYTPKNYGGGGGGPVSLFQALVKSQNIATVSLLKDLRWAENSNWLKNLQDVRLMFEQAGLYDQALNQPSIVLGTQETTLQRITQSYSYFSNGESLARSYLIDEAVDFQGQSLFKSQVERVSIPKVYPQSLEQIQKMMVEIGNTGTAARLSSFVQRLEFSGKIAGCMRGLRQNCFGGKTGTTNDGRDTWFVGFSKKFAVGVWVGYDEFRPIPGKSTGGALALPIFMDIVEKGLPYLPRPRPIIGSEGASVLLTPLFPDQLDGERSSDLLDTFFDDEVFPNNDIFPSELSVEGDVPIFEASPAPIIQVGPQPGNTRRPKRDVPRGGER